MRRVERERSDLTQRLEALEEFCNNRLLEHTRRLESLDEFCREGLGGVRAQLAQVKENAAQEAENAAQLALRKGLRKDGGLLAESEQTGLGELRAWRREVEEGLNNALDGLGQLNTWRQEAEQRLAAVASQSAAAAVTAQAVHAGAIARALPGVDSTPSPPRTKGSTQTEAEQWAEVALAARTAHRADSNVLGLDNGVAHVRPHVQGSANIEAELAELESRWATAQDNLATELKAEIEAAIRGERRGAQERLSASCAELTQHLNVLREELLEQRVVGKYSGEQLQLCRQEIQQRLATVDDQLEQRLAEIGGALTMRMEATVTAAATALAEQLRAHAAASPRPLAEPVASAARFIDHAGGWSARRNLPPPPE